MKAQLVPRLLQRNPDSLWTAPAFLGLVIAAVAAGASSLALPLRVSQLAGHSPSGVLLFYSTTSVAAGCINLIFTPRVIRAKRRGLILFWLLFAGAIGNAFIAIVSSWPAALASGVITCLLTVSYPVFMAVILERTRQSASRSSAAAREGYVVAFVVGLAAFGLVGNSVQVTLIAVSGLALVTAAISLQIGAPRKRIPGAKEAASPPARRFWLVGPAAAIVLLMKAADSLRGVYLPIYAVSAGLPAYQIAATFIVTTVFEIAVLRVLGHLSSRIGAPATIAWINGAAVVAFVALSTGPGFIGLLASQALYGVFAAGFQSIGLVLLAERTSSIGAGAGLYTAIVQFGGIAGLIAPTISNRFTPECFLVGAGFACIAAVVAILIRSRDRAARPLVEPT